MIKERANPTSIEMQCILCNASCDTYNKMIIHLSTKHYQKELLSLFGQDLSSCPVCSLKFASSYHIYDKRVHLALVHDKIFAVASQRVKGQLERIRALHLSCPISKSAWDLCKAEFQSGNVGRTCCSDFTSGPLELRFHLASAHYAEKLVSLYGEANKPCKQCQAGSEHGTSVAKDTTGIVFHMISSHPCQVFQAMSKTEAHWLQKCIRRDVTFKDSGGQKCPMCDSFFRRPLLLKVHLSTVHYRDEILRSAKIGEDVIKCPDCGKSLGRKTMGNEDKPNVPGMLKHLGMLHGYLDKVLPRSTRETLRAMERTLSKSGVENKNHSQVATKPTGCNLGTATSTTDNTSPKQRKRLRRSSSRDLTSYPSSPTPKSNDPVPCRHCHKKFDSAYLLKCHLSISHYKRAILQGANVTEAADGRAQCPLCSHVFRSKKCHHDTVRYLARHLGTMHGCLERVLPEQERKELYGQE